MERKRLRVDGVFDIECHGWSNYLVGVTVHSSGDAEVHQTPESMVRYMLMMGGVWWGHNSGKYDGLQVLEVLRQLGVGQSISMSQSRVTRTMGGGLTTRDSYAVVPLGLKYLAEMGGMQKASLWFDCKCGRECGGYCQLRPGMKPYMLDRVIEYCISDCRNTLAGLNAVQDFADEHDLDLTGTIGGSAWATAKRQLELSDADLPIGIWNSVKSAYYGGRCTVFRPLCNEPGLHWDMSAAYPAALAMTELPVGEPNQRGRRNALVDLGKGMPGIYSCTVKVPDSIIPPLPWRWGNRLSFPIGIVNGAWPLNELQYAESVGCEIVDVHWAITWDECRLIFDEWVDRIFSLRRKLGKSTAFGKWLRLFPNSLIGKFAERPDKRFVRMNPRFSDIVACPATSPCSLSLCSGSCGAWEQLDKWGQIWSVPFFKMSASSHVHWGAYVTAACRIMHHMALSQNAGRLVYCNTDSIWMTGTETPEPCGDGLGEWSRKCSFLDFDGPAPNQYAYTDGETGEYVVCSGGAVVNSREWLDGESIQDRGVSSLVEAARGDHGLFTRRAAKWTIPRHADWNGDRRVDGSGITSPVTCEELRTRLNGRRNGKQG